ncbi:Phage minor capsid protein 2 [Mycobacteroides abscessus subsp. abscessus]|nr:Phage minor capsid protein 2 [Mycobacteroides abscessus subsp. abscessus]
MSEQVSASDTDGLERPVVDAYEQAEIGLLRAVADAIAADFRSGATSPAAGGAALRRAAAAVVRRIGASGRSRARQALESAAGIGRDAAKRAVSTLSRRRNRAGRGGSPPDPIPETPPTERSPAVSGAPAIDRTPEPVSGGSAGQEGRPDALSRLRRTAPRAPRTARGVTVRTPAALRDQLDAMAPHLIASTEGLYRQVMTQVLAHPVDSEAARRRLAQRLLDQAAAKGITGFTDAGGRRWSMVSYVEMATRTAAAQTAIDAHCALLAEHGYDLVRVSVHANCSPMCAPFQGHLLSVTGETTSSGPEPWRPRVVASLAQARARGFNHPNCKHHVALWVPGDPLPEAPEVDPDDYLAEQQLRALERRLRAARRRKAVALDDMAARQANAAIRAYRAQIADHVAAHPTVLRKPHRERIDGPL